MVFSVWIDIDGLVQDLSPVSNLYGDIIAART